MAKEPRNIGEHIIALYGHIKGLKREIFSIKKNHLEHMHKDIDRLHGKMDRFLYWLLGGLGAMVIALLTTL
tara:strand:- start:21 stop:233 length:213 start_codon:yes stop_codon:yes gene_type:complete